MVRGSVPVQSYQRLKKKKKEKKYFIPPRLTLSIIRYRLRVSGTIQRKE